MSEFERKHPYFWLVLGLVLTTFSYGIFNTGICAWIFAVPLIRFINNRTKWSSIILMLAGIIIVANITFFRLVEDDPNIMNQVFCSFKGIRMWFPFLVYFLCRKFGAKRIIAYYAFPAAVAVSEFFIDNPFISVMTSLSVSQFWNLGLMQLASVTGVVGVSFVVTLFASVANYIWEEGIHRDTVMNAVGYGIFVVVVTGIGMTTVEKITTSDQTVKVAASVENFNLLLEDKSILARYDGSDEEKVFQANVDIIKQRAEQAARNEATLLVFPEDAFVCPEPSSAKFLDQAEGIAKDNSINILLPLLRMPEQGKHKNTLNFINSKGELLNTYLKNHLVPVVEEPETERGDGRTPVVEVDGVKYTYLICADYTSNKYAYNGREADIFLNPSYDWQAFQYFTSYGIQARAIECGFSVLRNPVNGNIILYDVFGRPLHMQNVMGVHTGMIYLDIPKHGRQTIYGMTGNWFPWICAMYLAAAILSGFFMKRKVLLLLCVLSLLAAPAHADFAALERGLTAGRIIHSVSNSAYLAGDGQAITEEAIANLSASDYGKTGLVADGNTHLILRYQSDKAGIVDFNVSPSIPGLRLERLTDRSEITSPVAAASAGSVYQASAVFIAPETWPDSITYPKGQFTVTATFTPSEGGTPTTEILTLTLQAPPVVLIHGEFGTNERAFGYTQGTKRGVWQKLEDAGLTVASWNYANEKSPKELIANNNNGLAKVIAETFDSLNAQGIVATRADLVTHSSGGLLARQYLRSDIDTGNKTANSYGLGTVRRVVTIASPNLGSNVSSFCAGKFETLLSSWQNCPAKNIWEGNIHSILKGLVFDKKNANEVIEDTSLNSAYIANLWYPYVPFHAIYGKVSADQEKFNKLLDDVKNKDKTSLAATTWLPENTVNLLISSKLDVISTVLNGIDTGARFRELLGALFGNDDHDLVVKVNPVSSAACDRAFDAMLSDYSPSRIRGADTRN